MKIHPTAENKEFSGGYENFDAQTAWKHIYDSLTDEQKRAWDDAYEEENKVFQKANLSGKDLARWKYQRYIKDYLRCVQSVDENIGHLLDYLDKNALSEKTIIIYTSDQGFFLGEHGWYDKRFMYEESIGIPLLIRYPQEISAGLVSDDMVLNLDICPTILDYAGIKIPKDVQGKSIRPLAGGKQTKNWRQSIYYHYYEYPYGWHNVKKHYGIRTIRYKLIHFYDDIDEKELFDLEKDPHEINNLYNQKEYIKIQQKLENQLKELQEFYQDSLGVSFD
jgi:arylsulfatase A-like enzyme